MPTGLKGQYSRYQGYFMNIVRVYNERANLRAFLEIILTLSTTIIFALFALKPTILTIISLTNEIKEKKATVQELDKKIRDLAQAANTLEQVRPSLENIDIAVNTVPKPDILAKQVLGISAKNSVEVSGMSVGETVIIGLDPNNTPPTDIKPLPGDPYSMPFVINIQGSYGALVAFVQDLEALRIITKVDNLTVSKAQSEEASTIVVAISGRTPYIGKN